MAGDFDEISGLAYKFRQKEKDYRK